MSTALATFFTQLKSRPEESSAFRHIKFWLDVRLTITSTTVIMAHKELM